MRLIDVHNLDILGYLEEFPECENDKVWNTAVREICTYVNLAPEVDAEPIVHCKDCVNSKITDRGRRSCSAPLGMYASMPVHNDDFCSNGCRKERETDG